FAGITAVGAILWVFLTQFDRLLMSKYLTLEEFGYFSLVVTISSGIMMLSGPVSTAILPRLTALYNSDNRNQMVELFIKATSLVSVTILPIAVMIICMPETILYFWTGNLEVASWG
ncbi:oligosaccharide flippase family protein, partial [Streptomyces sp. P9(2023)]|uniref:lipopolysaccharide biosynthesis protein n=1 Tax=Streptomyces sp. P9(2023) TaxID=3064394 RepID=UPI0028F4542D